MKWMLILVSSLAAMPAHSAEKSAEESRFHLLTTRCEAEAAEGPETTPQSPPLEVDDPSTPGCNRWEINVVVGGDLTRTGQSWQLPLLDLNYGIGDNLQLKYELPYVNDVAGDTRASAIGESRVGLKYQFFEDERSKTELAAYPQLTFVGAGSDAVQKGLATPGTILTLPVLLATRVGETSRGEISLTANLGYNVSSKADTADFVSAAVGLGTPLLNSLVVMGELATEQAVKSLPEESRAQLVKLDVGLMTPVSRSFLFFASAGHSLYASDQEDHTYALAGFRFLGGGTSGPSDKVAIR